MDIVKECTIEEKCILEISLENAFLNNLLEEIGWM